jgi:hypothetical protein
MIEKDSRTFPTFTYLWSIDPICSGKVEKVRKN